jgi:hypothetical protein
VRINTGLSITSIPPPLAGRFVSQRRRNWTVAAKRRKLPLGGQLKEDCVFQWANDGKIGKLADYRRWKQLPH